MNLNMSTVIGAVIIALALLQKGKAGPDELKPPPLPRPSAAFQRAVQPLREALADDENGANKATELSEFYREWAEVVSADNATIINSTGVLRDAHLSALRILDASEHPPVGSHLNDAMAHIIGLDNVKIDEEKQQDIIELMTAFAWACDQEQ